MRSVRVHRARHAIRRITALVALGVCAPHTSAQSVDRSVLVLHVESGKSDAGSCVATVTMVNAERVSPDTALAAPKTAEARRQRRTRLLEWGIQTLRVLDAILQATRVLLR
jgi:hypothetical protein